MAGVRPAGLDVSTALGALESARGGLLSCDGADARWQTFVPRPRLSAHAIRTRRSAGVAVL
jgi:hypothetical protein